MVIGLVRSRQVGSQSIYGRFDRQASVGAVVARNIVIVIGPWNNGLRGGLYLVESQDAGFERDFVALVDF
jgi:hypothetical protein